MKSDIVKQNIVDYINDLQPMCKGELGELQQYAYENEVPIIDRETVVFIKTLLAIKKPKKILEIGCAIGFSAIMMSEYLDDGGCIHTIERFDVMINQAKKNFEKFGVTDKITLLEGDANDILKTLDGEYDVIFMDAAKGQYINILDDCVRLLKKGGIIITDDIFQNGLITEDIENVPKRMRTIHRRLNEFLNTVSNMEELESSIVPIADGVLIACKK